MRRALHRLAALAPVALAACTSDAPADPLLAEAAAFDAGAPATVETDSVAYETALLGAAALARWDSLEATRPPPEVAPALEPTPADEPDQPEDPAAPLVRDEPVREAPPRTPPADEPVAPPQSADEPDPAPQDGQDE